MGNGHRAAVAAHRQSAPVLHSGAGGCGYGVRGVEGLPLGPPLPSRLGAHVGVLAAVLLVLGSAASSVSDYWMPAKTNSYKILAYVSQTMRKPDGTCPEYAPNHECSATGDQSWMNNFAGPRNH